MPILKEKKFTRNTKIHIFLILFLAIFLNQTYIQKLMATNSGDSSDVISKIEEEIEEKTETIKELENQAAAYQDQIKKLQLEGQSLANEIEIFNAQIAQLELEIKSINIQINEKNVEIKKLNSDIQQKEKDIEEQKEIIKNLLQQIYNYDKETLFEILLKSEKISDFFNETEYVDSFSQKIKKELDNYQRVKTILEKKKAAEQKAKSSLEQLQNQVQIKKNTLDTEKRAKQLLLDTTKGNEKQFQNLLSNVKEQKKSILGDINKLMAEKEKEIAKIAAQANKPTNAASTTWYFSQNDPRWKDDLIGVSNSTINDYGCAISCVAMIFKYHGIDIDPKTLARQPIFVRDLISWPTKWRFLDLTHNSYHKKNGLTAEDWKRIDKEIATGNPVIVFIKALGRNAGHYVVIHSKDSKGYIVHDPIRWNKESGANIYLSTTEKYLQSIYQTNTVVDQMIIYN